MSAVNDWIVRDYFEFLGFFVAQPRKYQVPGRAKTAEEEIDLIVSNPSVSEQRLPDHLVWTGRDFAGVARAVVGVRGWHTERFSPAVIELSPEIFRFAEESTVKNVAQDLGAGPVTKILCLPELPSAGPLRNQAMALFRDKGIDGVILFRTMLLELAERIDVNKNYEKSDVMQILRILKNYDLLKDAQLELFKRKRSQKK